MAKYVKKTARSRNKRATPTNECRFPVVDLVANQVIGHCTKPPNHVQKGDSVHSHLYTPSPYLSRKDN